MEWQARIASAGEEEQIARCARMTSGASGRRCDERDWRRLDKVATLHLQTARVQDDMWLRSIRPQAKRGPQKPAVTRIPRRPGPRNHTVLGRNICDV